MKGAGSMLKVNSVTKNFAAFRLDDISFEIPPGYICGLIGENGSGKTTLIRIICGLYEPTSGSVAIDGDITDEEHVSARQKTGVVLNTDIFDDFLTLEANGRRFGKYYQKYSREKLLEYISEFGLDPKNKYAENSKGEKLKFALAFALSYDPVLLVLDEPAANFDPEFREKFNRILREFTSTGERTVLLSTHIMSDAEQFSDYLLMLRKGKQVLFGDIETVRSRYRMVSGNINVIKNLKDRVISVEQGELGCRALVRGRENISEFLDQWEPSVEELMCFFSREGK